MRTINNIAIIIFGVLLIAGSLACVFGSLFEKTERSRWETAPLVQQAGELQTLSEGRDIVLVGVISSDTPPAREGLALYEYWTREVRYYGKQRQYIWEEDPFHSHKPVFEVLLGKQDIPVQSKHASFRNARKIQVSARARLEGFAPGDTVTVMGIVTQVAGLPQVRARYISGGERETSLKQFSHFSIIWAVIAALMFLGGSGLIGWGIVRLRAQSSSLLPRKDSKK
jgi:hypothetical protein